MVSSQPELVLDSLGMALDPRRRRPFAFISHPHADHVSSSQRILAHRDTARLVRERFANSRSEWIELEFDQPRQISGHQIELLPAGHTPGSAQLWVEREADGVSLLYTGDFKRRANLVAPNCASRRAHVLLMETSFGKPRYRFPSTKECVRDILAWIEAVQEDAGTPVLQAYSFGKAQELVAHLSGSCELLVHSSVAKMNRSCEKLGYQLGPWRGYRRERVGPRSVIIAPAQAIRRGELGELPGLKQAICTGWAVDSSAKYRARVDAAFPLSDHADYDELLAHVEEVDPELVLTTHGFAREFAADLRRRGREAWAIGEGPEQLDLFDGRKD